MLNNQDFALLRRKSLGGSDIGAILGFSKYRTPVSVWLEKTNQCGPQEENLAMRFGSFTEEFVANEYSRATGLNLISDLTTIVHPQYDFFTAHIDRFILPINQPLWKDGKLQAHKLLECKTAHPMTQYAWGDQGTDQVPMSYLVQCLWYLMMTNCSCIDLAVLFGNTDFRIYTIQRDLELESLLIQRALSFWQTHVVNKVAPPPNSESDCRNLFQREIPFKKIEATVESIEILSQLQELQKEILVKEIKVDEMKKNILLFMADAEELTFENKILATWKTPKATIKVDTKRLSAEHPDLVAPYQKTITNTRRLVIKDFS